MKYTNKVLRWIAKYKLDEDAKRLRKIRKDAREAKKKLDELHVEVNKQLRGLT